MGRRLRGTWVLPTRREEHLCWHQPHVPEKGQEEGRGRPRATLAQFALLSEARGKRLETVVCLILRPASPGFLEPRVHAEKPPVPLGAPCIGSLFLRRRPTLPGTFGGRLSPGSVREPVPGVQNPWAGVSHWKATGRGANHASCSNTSTTARGQLAGERFCVLQRGHLLTPWGRRGYRRSQDLRHLRLLWPRPLSE